VETWCQGTGTEQRTEEWRSGNGGLRWIGRGEKEAVVVVVRWQPHEQ